MAFPEAVIHSATPEGGCRGCVRLSFTATTHCLTGCAIGEVLGLVISNALGWADLPSIALAVLLAFIFGYSLTLWPLLRAGVAFGAAVSIALAADTLSIMVMEIVDNAIVLAVPGAMDAGLNDLLFWGGLIVALAIAFLPAFALNYYLIKRAGATRRFISTTRIYMRRDGLPGRIVNCRALEVRPDRHAFRATTTRR